MPAQRDPRLALARFLANVAETLKPDPHFAAEVSFFSHYCGDAGDWCIAAPGEVVTTHRDGRWILTGGTSFAAPYVAAGLAALKSLFPPPVLSSDSLLHSRHGGQQPAL